MTMMRQDAPAGVNWNPASKAGSVTVSIEVLAYVLLAVFVLVLRFAEIDTTPLTVPEAREALAAWRAVSPNATGEIYAAQSQIIFLAQSLAFTLLGASEFSARVLTALAGALLVLSPLLFRGTLGSARTFALSLLLAFSPVLLIGSRESSSIVWAGLFAVGTISALVSWKRRAELQEPAGTWAAIAAICAAALLFLCGAGGVVLAAIVALALAGASFWQGRVDDLDETDSPYSLRAFREFPFSSALTAALAVVLVAGTSFLLYPTGFSAVGSAFSGLFTMISPETAAPTPFHALVTSIFYEPHLWAGAVVALIVLVRGSMSFIDRFFILASIFGVFASLVFGAAPGAYALWLTLPLAGLASSLLVRAFEPDAGVVYLPAPAYARWVVAFGLLGAMAVFTLAVQDAARSMGTAGEGLLANVTFPADAVVLLFVSTSFIIIGFFLFASLWGSRTGWQGVILGTAVFFCITSLGSGWAVAVSDSEQPATIWRNEATNRNTMLLRQTLFELTERESRGFTGLPVYVMAEEDGVIAWLLRDYTRVTFIDEAREAAQQSVVLLPSLIEQPELGTAYVGQDFLIGKTWTSGEVYLLDLPAWWTQRLARDRDVATERYTLWLRQDIYDGVIDTLPGVG